MRVYIVFTESGKIYSVRKNRNDANKDKEELSMRRYETATIKEFNVR